MLKINFNIYIIYYFNVFQAKSIFWKVTTTIISNGLLMCACFFLYTQIYIYKDNKAKKWKTNYKIISWYLKEILNFNVYIRINGLYSMYIYQQV
jgi:hypothetical protein